MPRRDIAEILAERRPSAASPEFLAQAPSGTRMIVLGYSGLDASVRYARQDPDLRPGEERMVQGLDSAAALLADGRIIAAAAEERFGTEKHTNAFPQEAIQYCLNEAGISMGDVDVVAHGFDYGP